MSNNLPPLKRDDSFELERHNIYHTTEMNRPEYETAPKGFGHKQPNRAVKNTNLSHPNIPIEKNKIMIEYKPSFDENYNDTSYQDQSARKIVPYGYFDSNHDDSGITSQANTTSRHNDNQMLTSIELPNLQKTNYTETLYSLKAKTNGSPHDRIMKTIEKRKNKRNAKSMALNENNVKSQEIVIYKGPSDQKMPLIKQSNHQRNNANLSNKMFYEITTIEENDENHSTSTTQYHNLGLSKKDKMQRYNKINSDLENVVPKSKPQKNGYVNQHKPRGLSVRDHQSLDSIDDLTQKNHFEKPKASIGYAANSSTIDDDFESRLKSHQ